MVDYVRWLRRQISWSPLPWRTKWQPFSRRIFFTSDVSKEAAAHALRYGAKNESLGQLSSIGVGALNEGSIAEPVETEVKNGPLPSLARNWRQ